MFFLNGPAIGSLPHGKPLAETEKRQALCFLRLESATEERQLMTTLGASRFGDDLVVIVDLASNAA